MMRDLTKSDVEILGPDGRPIRSRLNGSTSRRGAIKSSHGLRTAIFSLDADPIFRALDPFANHAWVYAGAVATALNIAQAPFGIFVETEDEIERRISRSKRMGLKWVGSPAGKGRTAIQRHLQAKHRKFGIASKSLELAPEHPLGILLSRPNPVMTGVQLWEITVLWMQTRGEAFWLLFNDAGDLIGPGETPTRIWPIAPHELRELVKKNDLLAWIRQKGSTKQVIELNQIVQFKFSNPNNPFRGLSPLSAAAAGISTDMLAISHNRAVLQNGADPGGILTTDEGFQSEEEEQEFLERFEERHEGPRKSRRVALLTGGVKYIQTGLSMQDMEFMEQRRWDRDEILADMGVPKSIVSVTDDLNFATQLSQDRNFWDKRLMPMIRMFEDVLDFTLLFQEPDNVVGMFDLSGIEALRHGTGQKITDARAIAGTELHAPPSIAFDMVGLDVAMYEGIDTALVSPLLAPVSDVLEGFDPFGPPPPPPPSEPTLPDPVEPPEVDPPDDPSDEVDAEEAGAKPRRRSRQKQGGALWIALMRAVQQPLERQFARCWRRFIREEKRIQLELFDAEFGQAAMRRAMKTLKQDPAVEARIDAVLTPSADIANRLRLDTRPVLTGGLNMVFDFTVEELGGIATFEIDDPRLLQFFDEHQNRLAGTAPETIQNNLRTSMRAGLEAGETIQQLRDRVSQVFDISASSPKTLSVARTESASFMNGARDVMFEAQGFTEHEWITAGDEVVRDDHVIFGQSGPQMRGFNFMGLPGVAVPGPGRLRHPHDVDAPAGQVINCRCVSIPIG